MPESPEQREVRLRRWRHYGAIGQVRWALISLQAIKFMPSASRNSQDLADQAHTYLMLLQQQLAKDIAS